MPVEIERAYYTFDPDVVKGKLEALGGHHEGEFYFRQVQYFDSDAPTMYTRIRDTGVRVFLTIKRKQPDSDYDLEDEMVVSSFDTAVTMCELWGLPRQYQLEKLRDVWTHKGCEVVFDTYPGLPPYMEIEGPDEKIIRELASELGLIDEPQTTGARELYEKHYGITPDRPSGDLTMANADTVLGKHIKKEQASFEKRLAQHRRRATVSVGHGRGTKKSFVNENQKPITVSAGRKGKLVRLAIVGPDSTAEWEITPMEAGVVKEALDTLGVHAP
jgi:adenylate cyclase, class 2